MRIKINCRPMDPKHMEGRQVILQVERVDVELGEILCTLVAVSGDMCDGAIDIKPIKAEWVTPPPNRPPTRDEMMKALMEAKLGVTVHYVDWE